jgi:hypothetical protein
VNDLRDYLQKKAAELGLERGDQLAEIQAYLDELYPGQCRAASLNDGVLKITTSSASLASELRMRQTQLVQKLADRQVQDLIIQIAGANRI